MLSRALSQHSAKTGAECKVEDGAEQEQKVKQIAESGERRAGWSAEESPKQSAEHRADQSSEQSPSRARAIGGAEC